MLIEISKHPTATKQTLQVSAVKVLMYMTRDFPRKASQKFSGTKFFGEVNPKGSYVDIQHKATFGENSQTIKHKKEGIRSTHSSYLLSNTVVKRGQFGVDKQPQRILNMKDFCLTENNSFQLLLLKAFLKAHSWLYFFLYTASAFWFNKQCAIVHLRLYLLKTWEGQHEVFNHLNP